MSWPDLRAGRVLALAAVLAIGATTAASSAVSQPHVSAAVEAHLVTAQDGVPEAGGKVSAALDIRLRDGWKTYWRSPGQVGMAPEVDWNGSINVRSAQILWPAPTRFRAFGIENFGYAERVVLPLDVTLERPGEPVAMRAKVSLLVCSRVCVPETFDLGLTLGPGSGIDEPSADLVSEWAGRVPSDAAVEGVTVQRSGLSADGKALIVSLASEQPFEAPNVFPEWADNASFGLPDLRLSDAGRRLWASIPFDGNVPAVAPLLTVTDSARAFTTTLRPAEVAPPPPFERTKAAADASDLIWFVFLAVLGGAVLNLMPCVLPVLTIKLNAAVKSADQTSKRIRVGFLASAAGVMAFMGALASVLIALRASGVAVGWGLQFQSPSFLVFALVIVGLLAAGMAGLFEFRLPPAWNGVLARWSGRDGLAGDFATGAFAALLATPCSSPFLGTAVAFALGAGAAEVVAVFLALGLGLSLPYLAVAARPSLVRRLPRPGAWMDVLRVVLATALLAVAVWLGWVLAGVTSPAIAATVGALTVAIAFVLPGRENARWRHARAAGSVLLAALAFATPPLLAAVDEVSAAAVAQNPTVAWRDFERGDIARHVSRGRTVLVDVTADWCLTCKANKTLVLDRPDTRALLERPDVIAMRADWTRTDPAILDYLKSHRRFGIPFNAVYGPRAPDGIVLGEVLTAPAVRAAIEAASLRPLPPSNGDAS